jgi:hypothetical protein
MRRRERRRLAGSGLAAEDTDLRAVRLIDRLRDIAIEAAIPSRSGISSQDRRKVIVFSTYADTIDALHSRVASFIDNAPDSNPVVAYRDRIAPAVYGSRSSSDQDNRSRTLAAFAPDTARARSASAGAVWKTIEPLIPRTPDLHPLGCHRRRISDRLCFWGC